MCGLWGGFCVVGGGGRLWCGWGGEVCCLLVCVHFDRVLVVFVLVFVLMIEYWFYLRWWVVFLFVLAL